MYTFLGLDRDERKFILDSINYMASNNLLDDDQKATHDSLGGYLEEPTEAHLIVVRKADGGMSFYVSTPDLARLPILVTNEEYTEATERKAIDSSDLVDSILESVSTLRVQKKLAALKVAMTAWLAEVEACGDLAAVWAPGCNDLMAKAVEIQCQILGREFVESRLRDPDPEEEVSTQAARNGGPGNAHPPCDA